MGKVWALFTNSSACEISLNKTGSEYSDNLIFIPVAITDVRTRNSAEKAMRSAFSVLQTYINMKVKPFSFSYEFKMTSSVIDSSASLAFGLGLAMKYITCSFSIAATGVIDESSASAVVKPVDSKTIENKLLAAKEFLKNGDIIFYPQANHLDISDKVVQQIKTKGIILKSVNTVKEAVKEIIEWNNPSIVIEDIKKSKKRSFIKYILACIVFFGVFFSFIQLQNEYVKIEEPNLPVKKVLPVHVDTPENISVVCDLSAQVDTKKKVDAMSTQPALDETSKKIDIVRDQPVHVERFQKINVVNNENKYNAKPIRIKSSITGNHNEIVSDFKNKLSLYLQNNGFIMNNRQYHGTISGEINVYKIKEIPLRPYTDTAIVIEYKVLIDNFLFTSISGDNVMMGTAETTVKAMKGQRHILKDVSIDRFFTDGNALKNIKKLYYQ